MTKFNLCNQVALVLVLFSSLAFTSEKDKDIFPEEKSCVAYRTKKTFFFVRTVTVVGTNCDMSAEVIPEPGDKFHVEMTVPIAGFESGEAERDRDVAKMLKADVAKSLNFVSESISFGVWKEKLAEGHFALKGELYIGKKPYPITIEIDRKETKEGEEVFLGVSKAKFKSFDIDPPSLFAGIGAKVSSKLELLFRLQAREILGAQSLMRGK